MVTHLKIKEEFEEILKFDKENQRVMFVNSEDKTILDPFRTGDMFDHEKFFFEFLRAVHGIVTELGEDWSLMREEGYTMDPLTTSFVICETCANRDKTVPEVVRCPHKPGCPHSEGCGCREYTTPSLSRSKVGVVLHLSFTNEDGSKNFLDVDVNVPTMDVGTMEILWKSKST